MSGFVSLTTATNEVSAMLSTLEQPADIGRVFRPFVRPKVVNQRLSRPGISVSSLLSTSLGSMCGIEIC